MEIAKLGEFGLIDRLTKDLENKNESTKYGVGDDCAVLHYPDSEVLVTTDLLMEGVHFDLTYIDLKHLGYKSAMVNISDIFAMNGTPRQITVSLALSKRFTVEDMEEFYAGLRLACEKWGVDIVGGDTTSSYTGLAISITCIGEARKEDIVYRNGAKNTDLICVSGDLGAAYMGLQLLEREKSVYYGQVNDAKKKGDKKALEELAHFSPDFAGKEYLLQRQLQTEARGDIIQKLREAGIRPTAMMDVSDGLSSELMHICKQSGCGLSHLREGDSHRLSDSGDGRGDEHERDHLCPEWRRGLRTAVHRAHRRPGEGEGARRRAPHRTYHRGEIRSAARHPRQSGV